MEQWRIDADRGTQNEEGEMVGKCWKRIPSEYGEMILTWETWARAEKWRNDTDMGKLKEDREMMEWYWHGKNKRGQRNYIMILTWENWARTGKWWNDTSKGKLSRYGEMVEWYWMVQPEVLAMTAPELLRPPQFLHALISDFTHIHVVRGRRLTTWAMAGLHFQFMYRTW